MVLKPPSLSFKEFMVDKVSWTGCAIIQGCLLADMILFPMLLTESLDFREY